MAKEDLSSIKKALDYIYEKTLHQPVRVKINTKWSEKNIIPIMDRNGNILKTTEYKTIFGVPIEFDDSIPSYEFVYEEGRY